MKSSLGFTIFLMFVLILLSYSLSRLAMALGDRNEAHFRKPVCERLVTQQGTGAMTAFIPANTEENCLNYFVQTHGWHITSVFRVESAEPLAVTGHSVGRGLEVIFTK